MSISIKNNLSVVIPFYNEENTLPKIFNEVVKRPEVMEIILVDDGSNDNSYKIAKSMSKAQKVPFISKALMVPFLKHPKIKIIRHKGNFGKGSAMISGINKASGEYLIFQDADLETFPSDYPKLLKPLIKGKADFVIGTRWANHNGYFLAQLGNKILTSLINSLFFTNFEDSYCGYKVAKTTFFRKLNLKSKGFEIEAEIACKVAKSKTRMLQVDIKYKPRSFQEGKKINYRDVLLGVLKIIETRFIE